MTPTQRLQAQAATIISLGLAGIVTAPPAMADASDTPCYQSCLQAVNALDCPPEATAQCTFKWTEECLPYGEYVATCWIE